MSRNRDHTRVRCLIQRADIESSDGRRAMSKTKEGWGFPGQARKAHWMLDSGRSLCGGWGFYQGPVEQGNDDSPDNCQACKQRRLKVTEDVR